MQTPEQNTQSLLLGERLDKSSIVPKTSNYFIPHSQMKTRHIKEKSTPSKVTINGVLARKFYLFLNAKFLFDILYNKYIISEGLNLGFKVFKSLDKGLIENIGPFGLAHTFYKTSSQISKADTGVVTTYSLYISLGILSLLFLGYSPLYLDSLFILENPGIELSNILNSDVIRNVDTFIYTN